MYRLAAPDGHVRGRIPGGNIAYKIENGVIRLDAEHVPEFWVEIDAQRLDAKPKKRKRQNATICINVNTVCCNNEGDATGYTSARVIMMQEVEFRKVAGLTINNDVMIVDDASSLDIWTPLLRHLGSKLTDTDVHNETPGPYSKLLILNLKHPAFTAY